MSFPSIEYLVKIKQTGLFGLYDLTVFMELHCCIIEMANVTG